MIPVKSKLKQKLIVSFKQRGKEIEWYVHLIEYINIHAYILHQLLYLRTTIHHVMLTKWKIYTQMRREDIYIYIFRRLNMYVSYGVCYTVCYMCIINELVNGLIKEVKWIKKLKKASVYFRTSGFFSPKRTCWIIFINRYLENIHSFSFNRFPPPALFRSLCASLSDSILLLCP